MSDDWLALKLAPPTDDDDAAATPTAPPNTPTTPSPNSLILMPSSSSHPPIFFSEENHHTLISPSFAFDDHHHCRDPTLSLSLTLGPATAAASESTSHPLMPSPAAAAVAAISPPFPWATEFRAHVHTLHHLLNNRIFTIEGDVQCGNCKLLMKVRYDLCSNFHDMEELLKARHHVMYNKVPPEWKKPHSADCSWCNQKGSMRPVISAKKRSINWLFLFLGKAIHLCTLRQLKYFCKHNNTFRSGCKESMLYSAYMAIFRQLQPRLFD